MKGNREHRVPLSTAAVALLEHMRELQCRDYVFPGSVDAETVSRATLRNVIPRMNELPEAQGLPRWTDPKQANRDILPHGFRSCFKDWASE
jgi:integrase